MTIDEMEDEIKKYKRQKQVRLENILDAVKTIQEEFGEIAVADQVIEALLRRENEELRRKLHIERKEI